ncbi:MAG: GNAT family N-acetyltransferase [Phycisphaeraceae bacterium]|nr:GNAT family N-acetyltransferase [Phycisphaeraceae bacterium]
MHAKKPPEGFEVGLVDPPQPSLNRDLYRRVGEAWEWTDRTRWADTQWEAYVHQAGLWTYQGLLDGRCVGFCELKGPEGGDVQLCYFGLLPQYIGCGLGGAFLSEVVRGAWALPGTRRLWLHTCSNDHPHALDNYRKRGFEIYKTHQVSS